MADGLLSEIDAAIHHAIALAAKEMFGGGGPNPDAIRWEGMSNDQLATAVRLLREGPGASAVTQAAQALSTIANNLQSIDQTLHDQLQAIGVNWQSTASELAQEMTNASAAYSGAAGAAGGTNSTGVTNQGDAFSAAKNAVPSVSDLQSPPSGSFLDTAGGILTGHQNDKAAQAGRNQAARNAAIDAMQGYGNSSQAGLSAHQPLPPPPGFAVAPQPVTPGGSQVTSVSSFVPPPAGVPGGGGGFPGGGSSGGSSSMPGLPGLPGVPGGSSGGLPGASSGAIPGGPGSFAGGGGFSAGGGAPGSGALPGAGALPGVGGLPGEPVVGVPTPIGGTGPLSPGPVSGVGPVEGPLGSAVPAGQAGAAASSALIEDAAIGAAIVGGTAGAGIAGASARPDRLVRSRLAGEDYATEEGSGARQETARALAELEGEEAEAAVSERIGATAEPPPTLLEPAMSRRRTDDETHDTRYGVDDDLFGDGRMVVPPVLDGSDPTESK